MTKVLIIEDDLIFGEMLRLYLTGEQYDVLHAQTAKDGLELLGTAGPDIILLDLMLPDADGSELCGKLRETTAIPIIVVSMKSEVNEKIKVLMAGADDYLCKPFSMQELKARIETVMRRALQPAAAGAAPSSTVDVSEDPVSGRIRIDLEKRTIVLDGKHTETTYSSFEIMRLFCQHPGRVFSREELINALRGVDSFVNDRAIDVHVTNLRKKIEINPKEPKHIKTVWGVGYKFLP